MKNNKKRTLKTNTEAAHSADTHLVHERQRFRRTISSIIECQQDIFRNSIIVKHFSKNFEISTQKIATLSTRSNASPVTTELLGEQNKIAATRSNSMK
jgi:hypothetical protein